jgi:type VI secretion system protein ImpA
VLDVDSLLAEIPGGPRGGAYLEYEPVSELERMAADRGGQRMGDTVAPADEPDWQAVRERAIGLFRLTWDLRVAVLLTRALVRTAGIAGLAEGLGLIRAMLERSWDDVNPPLYLGPEREYDPAVRMNALAPLAHGEGLVRDARHAALVTGPAGRVTVRDALMALGRLAPAAGEVARGPAEVAAAIKAGTEKSPGLAAALQAAIGHVEAIGTLLAGKDDPVLTLNLSPLADLLKAVLPLCESAAPAPAPAAGSASVVAAPRTDIRDRDEAIHLLEAICQFFERTEPTNPGPLFMRRAQRLLNKSFVDIIQDLAPDTLHRIEDITGLKKKT